MYDSVTIFVDSQVEPVLSNLNRLKEIVDHQTGERIITGNYRNLRVKVNYNGFSISGSLPKYFFGNNLEVLTKQTTYAAIESLSDIFGVAVDAGRVYILEIGFNFIMEEAVSEYLRCFGETTHYAKKPYKTGLQFVNSLRALSFYDKQAEMKKNKARVPDGFESMNILRYELKLNKRVAKQLGKNEVLASDLYDDSFIIRALGKYQSEYFKIKRLGIIRIDDVSISTIPQLHKFLGVVGVQTIGESDLLTRIGENRDSLSKGQFSRVKKRVHEFAGAEGYSEPSTAMLELDSKVNEVVKAYE
jgi:hypothetical protein